eukprot:589750-Amphidinium_carterae.1
MSCLVPACVSGHFLAVWLCWALGSRGASCCSVSCSPLSAASLVDCWQLAVWWLILWTRLCPSCTMTTGPSWHPLAELRLVESDLSLAPAVRLASRERVSRQAHYTVRLLCSGQIVAPVDVDLTQLAEFTGADLSACAASRSAVSRRQAGPIVRGTGHTVAILQLGARGGDARHRRRTQQSSAAPEPLVAPA